MATVRREAGPGQQGLEVLVKGMGALQAKVGWFEANKYKDGTPVAYIAAIQEFGSPQNRIPPRSFMRTTITEEKAEWAKKSEQGARGVLAGQFNPQQVLDGLAQQAAGDVRKKIASIYSPELSDLTLLVRKYKRGLIPGLARGEVTGRTLGMLWGMYERGEIDTSGVTDKPLVDSGIMLDTLNSTVEKT